MSRAANKRACCYDDALLYSYFLLLAPMVSIIDYLRWLNTEKAPLAATPLELLYSVLIVEEQAPNPYDIEFAKALGQITLPVTVAIFFGNSGRKTNCFG